MILILDEWIIHDLQNDNGQERQIESFQFLQKIKKKCDKIVIVKNSKFIKKIYDFSKLASKSVELRKKIKVLWEEFLDNSQKTLILDLENTQFEEIESILQNIKPDDHYIVKAYFYLKSQGMEAIIITTDEPLIKELEKYEIKISHRNAIFQYCVQ